MLGNAIGVALYLLLRNDCSWALLSEEEKLHIKNANEKHNTLRKDYTSPYTYASVRTPTGENWENFSYDDVQANSKDIKYKFISKALENYKPKNVLEVGPGAGYMSHLICHQESVREYDMIDINSIFIDYISSCINNDFHGDSLTHKSYVGDASTFKFNKKYDMIVILSAVHHIPDRFTLFNNLKKHLSGGGVIIAVDPSHYLKRLVLLSYKMIKRGYLKSSYYRSETGLSTHHMCSLGEYKKISKYSNMKIQQVEFNRNKLINIFPFHEYLSSQIGIILKNKQS